LLEATGKKTAFLQHMVEVLGLEQINVVHGRAEELAHNAFPLDSLGFGVYTFPPGRRRESMTFLDPLEGTENKKGYRAAFDVVTARAVSSLPILLEYCAPYCRIGGYILLPKKGAIASELEQGKRVAVLVGASFHADISVDLPGLNDGRRILVWQQQKACPAIYPRSGAAMAKKPLGS
jgi:16S rRNA (guanine527-N7)-methyltransferase